MHVDVPTYLAGVTTTDFPVRDPPADLIRVETYPPEQAVRIRGLINVTRSREARNLISVRTPGPSPLSFRWSLAPALTALVRYIDSRRKARSSRRLRCPG